MKTDFPISTERYMLYILFGKRDETWYSFPRYYVELNDKMQPIALYATLSLDDDARFNDWLLYTRKIVQHVHQDYFACIALHYNYPVIVMRY